MLKENQPIDEKDTNKPKTKKKTKFRIWKLFLFITIVLIIWWYNNFTIKINTEKIKSPKVASNIRIAVLSDYHAVKYGISPEKIIHQIEKADPDLVFFLGDMYTEDSDWDEIQIAVDLMSGTVKEGYSSYFVAGEHDRSEKYYAKLAESGVHVMNYQYEVINVNGTNLGIFGIDNAYFSPTFDLSNAFIIDESNYNILLAHIPMYEHYEKFGADLTLCGDTHGGIIQLPFGRGPAYYQGNWFPEIKGQKEDVYDKGLFNMKNGFMYITSGIGNSPFPARFNNRPEIAVIDIVPSH